MSDLTEYDRRIIEAAEYLVGSAGWSVRHVLGIDGMKLWDAVQAKRAAQEPKCGSGVGPCMKPAVQEITSISTGFQTHRCDKHRIEVREL